MKTCSIALAVCLLLAGCSSPDPPGHDAGPPDAGPPDAGPCAERAAIYGIDVHDEEQLLAAGSALPITLGFQGFQYVRVGLRTPRALPATVDLWVHVGVEGALDLDTAFFGVETRAAEGDEAESVDVAVMFNDVPLAELLGQKAAIRATTTSPGCALAGSADVVLVQGAYQGPDGGDDAGDGDDGG
jgi:hypothetical protein